MILSNRELQLRQRSLETTLSKGFSLRLRDRFTHKGRKLWMRIINDKSLWMRILIASICLALGVLFSIYVFPPIQIQLALSLLGYVEPFVIAEHTFESLSFFLVVASRIFFLPFSLYLFYRFAKWGLLRLVSIKYPFVSSTADSPRQPKAIARRTIKFGLLLPARMYLLFCTAVVGLEILFFVGFAFQLANHGSGTLAFSRHCGYCHTYTLTRNYILTKRVWTDKLGRYDTIIKSPDFIEKKEQIIDLLSATNGYPNRRLVNSKCRICHKRSSIFDRPRTAAQWQGAVDRIWRRNMFHISVDQAAQLTEFITGQDKWTLADPLPGTQAHRDWDEKLRFEKKCGTCHTLDIILRPMGSKEDLVRILERMGKKQPDILSVNSTVKSFLKPHHA